MSHENVSSGICGQKRPWSACASVQSVQGLRCPLTELLDTIECIKENNYPNETSRAREMNLKLCIMRMLLARLIQYWLYYSKGHFPDICWQWLSSTASASAVWSGLGCPLSESYLCIAKNTDETARIGGLIRIRMDPGGFLRRGGGGGVYFTILPYLL